MSATIERYVSEVTAAHDLDDVDRALDGYLSELGFDQFAYHVLRPPDTHAKRIWFYNYPEEWCLRYFEHDYKNTDPIMLDAISNVTPFRWDEANAKVPEKSRVVMHEAGEFGLRQGVTVPIHGPSQALATLNIATDSAPDEFDDKWTENRHELHLLAIHAHEAVLRLVYDGPEKCVVRLSPRERECLLWASRGKTAWETGEILDLSGETVVSYLKASCHKLGVYSKTHAVVKAILLGLIIP